MWGWKHETAVHTVKPLYCWVKCPNLCNMRTYLRFPSWYIESNFVAWCWLGVSTEIEVAGVFIHRINSCKAEWWKLELINLSCRGRFDVLALTVREQKLAGVQGAEGVGFAEETLDRTLPTLLQTGRCSRPHFPSVRTRASFRTVPYATRLANSFSLFDLPVQFFSQSTTVYPVRRVNRTWDEDIWPKRERTWAHRIVARWLFPIRLLYALFQSVFFLTAGP